MNYSCGDLREGAEEGGGDQACEGVQDVEEGEGLDPAGAG